MAISLGAVAFTTPAPILEGPYAGLYEIGLGVGMAYGVGLLLVSPSIGWCVARCRIQSLRLVVTSC